jgi:hypothetical protein
VAYNSIISDYINEQVFGMNPLGNSAGGME